MKNLLFITAIFFAISCNYEKKPLKPISGGVDTTLCPEPTFPANTNTKRNVLVEDFTGHKCTFCPVAAYIIDTIKQNRGSQIIAIGMHVSDLFASPNTSGSKFTTDFRTTDGNILEQDFAPGAALPTVMVNRIDTFSSPKKFNVFYLSMPNPIASLLNSTPKANLQIITTFDPANRTLCAYVETEALVNLSGDYSMVIALTEDSIIDWQKYTGSGGDPIYGTGSRDISDYKHSHVLRKNINGTYGKTIITGSATAGDKIITGTTYKNINTNWDEHHFYVVAYLYNNSTKEIIQVAEIHVN